MDTLCGFLCLLVTILGVLVSVAFITLMEQKVLSLMQIRIGPNKTGYQGLMQPFADAMKLLSKENMVLWSNNKLIYYLSPSMMLGFSLMLWVLLPFYHGGFDFKLGIFFFICVSSLSVFPLLLSGWASNCKYSLLGSLRAVAQLISYEVSMIMVLLSIILMSNTMDIGLLFLNQSFLWSFFIFFPLSMIWFSSTLAETNRTPFDFSEGESELVSGFNTEYSSSGFVIMFMSEYMNIIFMSMLFCVLFLNSNFIGWTLMVKSMLVSFTIIWVRSSLPRFRYDKLMYLAWKSFLPMALFMFIYYFSMLEL